MDDHGDSLEPEVWTANNLESKLKDLLGDDNRVVENVYVEVPKVKLENIIISNEEVHKYINDDWKN